MEIEQKESQLGPVQHDATALQELQENNEVVPGVPVVRSNTPRPLSFERVVIPGSSMGQPGLHFPNKAPVAPPLPEEVGEGAFPPLRLPESSRPVGEEAQDFVWLFEYGLEMDPGVLNSTDRLNGLALLYGPASLKGYTILCGSLQTGHEGSLPLTTILPVAEPEAEVWGVLYRIPRRLAEPGNTESAMLDLAHLATIEHNLFKPVSLMVREGYRNREISCITYVAIEQVLCQASLAPVSQARTQPLVQRLALIARQQKLPENYLNIYEVPKTAPVAATSVQLASPRVIQDTEPLPVLKEQNASLSSRPVRVQGAAQPMKPSRWLVGLALYLILMLLLILIFAVLQGLGVATLTSTNKFTLLSAPWLVVMYGLLGGCISCLYSLARSHRLRPPLFVTLTWFARPFVGGVLALFAYLLLTSGAFVLNPGNPQQQPIFLLGGALAGLCEGKLFFRVR